MASLHEASDSERSLVGDLLGMCGDAGHEPPNILIFKNIQRGFKVPFVLYCDFESFISDDDGKVHTPSGYSILRVSAYKNMETLAYTYSDDNVMEHFYEILRKIDEEIC